MARSRMRTKIPQLEEAFVGYFTDHHRFLLAKMLSRIDALDADIADVEAEIDAQIAPFAAAVARLDEIPGVGATAAAVIIAEVGVDMTRFPTPAHLSSWAGSPAGSKSPLAARRAPGPRVTATGTLLGSWARPRSGRAGPTRSWAGAIGASPAAVARRRLSSR
jgi:transposase